MMTYKPMGTTQRPSWWTEWFRNVIILICFPAIHLPTILHNAVGTRGETLVEVPENHCTQTQTVRQTDTRTHAYYAQICTHMFFEITSLVFTIFSSLSNLYIHVSVNDFQIQELRFWNNIVQLRFVNATNSFDNFQFLKINRWCISLMHWSVTRG